MVQVDGSGLLECGKLGELLKKQYKETDLGWLIWTRRRGTSLILQVC